MTSARRRKPTTKAKKRNYRAEYRRRKALAKAKGRSLSQARGHPKPTESSVSVKPTTARWSRVLERAVKLFRSGMPLTNAAKAEHVSSERLRAYVLKSGIARRTGRGWVIKVDLRIRRMQSTTTEGRKTVDVALDQASKVGTHESAIGRFVEDNDFAHLKPFIGQGFFDIHGKQHNFETRPNHLYRLANSGGESFENIYRVLA